MPCMPRPSNPKLLRKGKNIAFYILGVPPNMQKQKNMPPFTDYVRRRLVDEQTTQVR